MSDDSQNNDLLNLVIQPGDQEATQSLTTLGFVPVRQVPQLLYRVAKPESTAELFAHLSHSLSEASQATTRFSLTRSPLHSKALLVEFLHAQPLSSITHRLKHDWFLQALENRTFVFHYQPIYNLASGEVSGYECLARAPGDRDQFFNGQQIIDAALSTQSTEAFDCLARETCINAIAQINNGQTFFINVLPNALLKGSQSLERNFQQVLDLGLQPKQIVFELTEVETLAQQPELIQVINRMRELGYGIAVDDLGGCAAIDHYCMAFQPDVIKLDRRLIQGCSRLSLQQLLLKSLLYSAHELGILVVAEGLEDAEDIAFCRDIGVDLGQGFGLGRPDVILQQTRLDVLRFQVPTQLQPVAIAAPAVPNVSQFSLRKRRFKRALNCI